jgi:hypothetical protein
VGSRELRLVRIQPQIDLTGRVVCGALHQQWNLGLRNAAAVHDVQVRDAADRPVHMEVHEVERRIV